MNKWLVLVGVVFFYWTACLANYQGVYVGTYSGGDRGTWQVAVDSSGNMTGWARSVYDDELLYGYGTVYGDGVAGFLVNGAEFSGSIGATAFGRGNGQIHITKCQGVLQGNVFLFS